MIGLEFSDTERDMLVEDLNAGFAAVTSLHGTTLSNDVIRALRFDVEARSTLPKKAIRVRLVEDRVRRRRVAKPARPEDLAFLSVSESRSRSIWTFCFRFPRCGSS